jgi:hypothetical protein
MRGRSARSLVSNLTRRHCRRCCSLLRYAQAAASYVESKGASKGGKGGAKGTLKAAGKADRFAESKKNAAMITAMANRWM